MATLKWLGTVSELKNYQFRKKVTGNRSSALYKRQANRATRRQSRVLIQEAQQSDEGEAEDSIELNEWDMDHFWN